MRPPRHKAPIYIRSQPPLYQEYRQHLTRHYTSSPSSLINSITQSFAQLIPVLSFPCYCCMPSVGVAVRVAIVGATSDMRSDRGREGEIILYATQSANFWTRMCGLCMICSVHRTRRNGCVSSEVEFVRPYYGVWSEMGHLECRRRISSIS